MREGTRHQLILVAVCAVTFFSNLGATHLWEEDEAYFGRTAREMLERGDYIVPYFNGKISLHKPVLMYWVMIVGFKLFGATEFAARFGSALFGIANVLLTYQLGRLLFSPRVGFWSALVLGSCLHFTLVSRAAVADPELIFFCTLPILIFVAGTRLSRRQLASDHTQVSNLPPAPIRAGDLTWPLWALAYASMAVASLAKGPVGILLPTAVIGLFLLLMRADQLVPNDPNRSRAWPIRTTGWLTRVFWPPTVLRTTWQMRPLTALAMIALIAVPWYYAVGVSTGGAWLKGFFLVHNYGRFMNSFEGHSGGPLYYLVAICIGTYPWCIFNYQGIRQTIDGLQHGNPDRPAFQLLCAWVAVWVGAFTLAGTKLPHYVLPAYPAIAIVFGRFIERWLSGASAVNRNGLRTSWATLILVGTGILIAIPIVAGKFVPGEQRLALLGLIPLAGGIIGLWASERHRRELAAGVLSVVAVTFVIGMLAWGAVRVDRHQKSHVVASWIHQLAPNRNARLGACGCFEASLLYYCDRHIDNLGQGDSVARFFARHADQAYLITTDSKLTRIAPYLPADVHVLRETPRFLKHEQLLLIGRSDRRPARGMTAHRRLAGAKAPSGN